KYRLKTVDVTVSGQQRGAYALSYDQAPFSNASRLVRVDRYGKDVAIDTNTGVISGGTSKLIRAMSYSNIDYAYTRLDNQFPDPDSNVIDPTGKVASQQAGDLNYDGKDELYGGYTMEWQESEGGGDGTTSYYSLSNWNLRTFNNDGSVASFKQLFPDINANPLKIRRDDNGEVEFTSTGRFNPQKPWKDAGYVEKHTTDSGHGGPFESKSSAAIRVNDPNSITATTCAIPGNEAICNVLAAGANGSNKRNYATLDSDGDGVDELYGLTRFNIGSGGLVIGVADMSANGRQVAIVGEGSTISMVRFVGGQTQKTTLAGVECNGGVGGALLTYCALADVNGDGATDIIDSRSDNLKIWLSTGRGYQRLLKSPADDDFTFGRKVVFRDFDNDGKADLIQVKDLSPDDQYGPIFAHALWFQADSNQIVQSPFTGHGTAILGDFNGDGLPDFI
ncbi:FG-GAP repeat domain-containing protein, partial [Phyllobacterium myrsinacearum]